MALNLARKKADSPTPIAGLEQIAENYSGYIIDLWGVLHNGQAPYPGALDALELLRSRGANLCLLSNSPRKSRDVARKLEAMGIAPALYDHLITSGDAALKLLADPDDPIRRILGPSFYHIGPEDGFGLLQDVRQLPSQHPATASFVLVTGTAEGQKLSDYEAKLETCAALELPMLCANPDLVVRVGEQLVDCAGRLAQRYQELGGKVFFCGKPHIPIYRECFHRLGLMPWTVLAVGDAMATDVAGANFAGLDIAFVTGGIHRDELDTVWGEEVSMAKLEVLMQSANQRPDFVMPCFRR